MAKLAAIHEIRRQNLERLVETRFQQNASKLARALKTTASYVNDRLKPGGRTIGETAARNVEDKVGLLDGQLDIADSQLLMNPNRIDRIEEELRAMVDGLSDDEKRSAHEFVSTLMTKRKKRRRT